MGIFYALGLVVFLFEFLNGLFESVGYFALLVPVAAEIYLAHQVSNRCFFVVGELLLPLHVFLQVRQPLPASL